MNCSMKILYTYVKDKEEIGAHGYSIEVEKSRKIKGVEEIGLEQKYYKVFCAGKILISYNILYILK